jgi:AraC family transcriptional regulator
VRHSDCYGRDGATILSLKVHDTALWTASAAARDWGWSRLGAARVSEILRLLTSPSLGEPLAGVYELLASIGAGRPGRGTPPRWLREVSERLVEEPAVRLAQLSREAGVHPVYLSRAFRTWFGCSPKSYRLNRRTSAAIGVALTCRTRAADIAHDAAFADQSHMARSIKEMTGHSLTQLRAMLGHARPAAEPARRS